MLEIDRLGHECITQRKRHGRPVDHHLGARAKISGAVSCHVVHARIPQYRSSSFDSRCPVSFFTTRPKIGVRNFYPTVTVTAPDPTESGEAVLGQKDLGVCTTKSPGTPQKSPGSPNGGWWWFFADKQVE